MSVEESVEPLVVVTVRHRGSIRWFRSERELWVLDLHKWRNEFVEAGYEVPNFADDYRFGMHQVDETNADRFLQHISADEIARDDLSVELARRYPTARSWWDVGDLFPIMFADFDNKTAAGFYHEGIPMERYAPDGWRAEFIDFANDYPEDIFPRAEKFWVKGNSDLLELLNERGRSNQ